MRFQFHKGTIKTYSGFKFKKNIVKFQFHKGTIKTYTPSIPAASDQISIP